MCIRDRSVVLSDVLKVSSDWASGTYLTHTTMFNSVHSFDEGDR